MYRLYYPNVYRDDVSHCPDPSVSTSLVTRKDAWNDCVVKVPLSVANVFPDIFKAFSHFFDEMDTIIQSDVISRLKMTKEQIRWCQDDDACNGAVMDGSLSGPQTVLAMVDAFDDHISNGEFAILETERVKQEAVDDVDDVDVAVQIHEARERWGIDRILSTGSMLSFSPEDMERVVENAGETVAFASTCPSCEDGVVRGVRARGVRARSASISLFFFTYS